MDVLDRVKYVIKELDAATLLRSSDVIHLEYLVEAVIRGVEVESRNKERARCLSVVKQYRQSFDDGWYVCLPPQDVIGNLIGLLEDNDNDNE